MRSRGRYSRDIPRGNINDTWKHDLYEDENPVAAAADDNDDDVRSDVTMRDADSDPQRRSRSRDADDRRVIRNQRRDRKIRGTKVLIENLNYEILESDLRTLFHKHDLKTVRLEYDQAGRSIGRGYVIFASEQAAEDAVNEFDAYELHDQTIRLKVQHEPRHRMRDDRRPYHRSPRNDRHRRRYS